MKNEKNKEKASRLEMILNDFGFDAKGVAEVSKYYMHRTNQQTLTRFCLEWLKICAADDYPYDDRNKASHILAKMLLDGHDDLPGLPFI